MPIPRHIYIVDDDPVLTRLVGRHLERQGYRVTQSSQPRQALTAILAEPPAAVLLDIMMPDLDGLEMCRLLRQAPGLGETRIVIVSTKTFDFDRRQAHKLGANAFLSKPVDLDQLSAVLTALLLDQITVTYWGVRGTLPVPGAGTLRYGGNTSCVTIGFPQGELFIFDAGSGIKALSDHSLHRQKGRLSARIFISHPHWDHINALPFFAPLYLPGNAFEICGPAHGSQSLESLIGAQMDGVYFPITMQEFGATVTFRDLHEETVYFGDIAVSTMLLNHPGYCLGYRVQYKDRSVCYITDNELPLGGIGPQDPAYRARLERFVTRCDLLIIDATYFDEDYPRKTGWGHSAITPVVELAHRAEVGMLHLFHHDPDQNDDAIDRKLEQAQAALAALGSRTRCDAPCERRSFHIDTTLAEAGPERPQTPLETMPEEESF